MSGRVSTASSVRSVEGTAERTAHWVFLRGNRIVVGGLVAVAVVALCYGLVRIGVVAVGPRSAAASVFSSGLASGTVTLVTIALSIDQLILSRVFGSPDELFDRLDGTRALRRRVRELSDESAVPNDSAAFLDTIAGTVVERANRLESAVEADDDPPDEVAAFAGGIASYGESISGKIEDRTAIVSVLEIVLGIEYARNMTATEHVRNEYDDRLSETAAAELDAIRPPPRSSQ